MTEKKRDFSRGALAKKTGVNIETIRYYEKIGLMPDPLRTEAGYRVYDTTDQKRLMFVRRCRELGFSLDELRGLLGLVDGGDYTCAQVRDLTIAHLGDVRQKIRDLRKMERTLKEMVSQCDGELVPECPIVDALFSGGGSKQLESS
jgi:MerR family transcriptional regulator, mercuric resistance operon regulatory protein